MKKTSRFEWARLLCNSLLDFVYPPHCPGCGRALEEAGEYLCGECWSQILAPVPARCLRCGRPVGEETALCPDCVAWEPRFERGVVLTWFEGTAKQAIHALKFGRQRGLAREMGRRMGRVLAEELGEIDLLVPVPLHPARQRERGYNQSDLIARGLGEVLDIRVDEDLLERRVNTHQQARLDARQRRENLRGAFRCRKAVPGNACIGLVDDVMTTGATLDACALALAGAGAGRIQAIALASPLPAEEPCFEKGGAG